MPSRRTVGQRATALPSSSRVSRSQAGRPSTAKRTGESNALGARALYLYQGARDTVFRIHGTNEPWLIGTAVSNGCIRLTNEDIIDLYDRTPLGTPVLVS